MVLECEHLSIDFNWYFKIVNKLHSQITMKVDIL